jgi:hypothetical protein
MFVYIRKARRGKISAVGTRSQIAIHRVAEVVFCFS